MLSVGQVICFSLSLIALGAAMMLQLVVVVAVRHGMDSAGERIFATLPALILLLVSVFFGWLALLQSPWFG